MWSPGFHTKKPEELERTNDKLAELKGELSTDEAQIAIARYLHANPCAASELLFGVELYPFQDLMIRTMMAKDFVLAVCSRGLSKSFSSAIFASLYAIFYPGIKIGICSASFRQARSVFSQIEDFAATEKGSFWRDCIVGNPSHKNDAWEMRVGTSKIVALPLGDGGKIRGYRFNLMLIDELLLLSEKVVEEVIKPFMAVQVDPIARQRVREAENKLIGLGMMTEDDRTRFPPNKLIGLTSASYEFEYLYKLYTSYKKNIFNEDAKDVSHAIFQLSYDIAPEGLYDKKMVEDSRKTMTEAQYAREFGARFTGDSAGYFSARKMQERTVPPGEAPHTEIVGDPDAEYVLAIDPNYNDSEASDHFAMCLLKLTPENEGAVLVHAYALSKSSLKARANYMTYLTDNFNIVYCIVDAAGGKKFIQDINELDMLNEPLKLFEHDFDNSNPSEGLSNSWAAFRPEQGKICHAQNFSKTSWIREANEHLSVCIEQGRLWFASAVDATAEATFQSQKEAKIPIEKLDFQSDETHYKGMAVREKNKLKQSDFIENQGHLIQLTKDETALIVITTTATGTQRFDLPPELLRDKNKPDRVRKDSYTVLFLGMWGVKCFYELKKLPAKKFAGIRPFFIQ